MRKNIIYSYMGKYFGARPGNIELYNEEGYLDFEKVAQSDLFIKGMKKGSRCQTPGTKL